jgi:hypothetical protein
VALLQCSTGAANPAAAVHMKTASITNTPSMGVYTIPATDVVSTVLH